MSCAACARSVAFCQQCRQARCGEHLVRATDLRLETVLENQLVGFSPGPFGSGPGLPASFPVYGPVPVRRWCLYDVCGDGAHRLVGQYAFDDSGQGEGPEFLRGFRHGSDLCHGCRTGNGRYRADVFVDQQGRALREQERARARVAERESAEREQVRRAAVAKHEAFIKAQPGGVKRFEELTVEHAQLDARRVVLGRAEVVRSGPIVGGALSRAATTLLLLIVLAALSTQVRRQLPGVAVWPALGLVAVIRGLLAWRRGRSVQFSEVDDWRWTLWVAAVVGVAWLGLPGELASHLAENGPVGQPVAGELFILGCASVSAACFALPGLGRRRAHRSRLREHRKVVARLNEVAAELGKFACRCPGCPVCKIPPAAPKPRQ